MKFNFKSILLLILIVAVVIVAVSTFTATNESEEVIYGEFYSFFEQALFATIPERNSKARTLGSTIS